MISDDKIKHIIGVARLMKKYSEEKGFDNNYCLEMFTLGLLHDIGYEFSEHSEHNSLGGQLLKSQSYKYFKEVLYHGIPKPEYASKELDILNFADMHIDSKGNFVSFTERLDDIKNRYGETSNAYKNSQIVVETLISKGFN